MACVKRNQCAHGMLYERSLSVEARHILRKRMLETVIKAIQRIASNASNLVENALRILYRAWDATCRPVC
jgi:hypothetical protein